MTSYRILMAGSLPLSAPWNGADKNLARLIVEYDTANTYIVHTGLAEQWAAERVHAVRSRRISSMPTSVQKLRSFGYLLSHAPSADLVHIVASIVRPSYGPSDVLRGWLALVRRPLIHTVPSVGDAPVSPRNFPGSATVTVSEYTRRLLQEKGVPNVVRVYPPLDQRWLRSSVDAQAAAKGLDLGPRAVLYPAHYGPDSGIREMIQAFARLPQDVSDAVLVLACRAHSWQDPKHEEEQARRWAQENGITGRVRFVHNVPDMPSLIAACAVTALVPARLSGKMDLPMVILESLALGHPVIVTNAPPMNEALLGEGGLAVDHGDVDGLSAALARLLRDEHLRHKLGLQGRAAVSTQCDPERVVQSYQVLYESVLSTERTTILEGTR